MPLRSEEQLNRGKQPPVRGMGRPTWKTDVVDVEFKMALVRWAHDPDYPTPVLLEEMFGDMAADGFTVADLSRCLRFERAARSQSRYGKQVDSKALCTPTERAMIESSIKTWGKKFNLPGWEELDAPVLESSEDAEKGAKTAINKSSVQREPDKEFQFDPEPAERPRFRPTVVIED